MTYECFDVSIDDNVAHIVLSRPEKRNSMVPSFWNDLPKIVQDIDHNNRARVIVLSSTGPHFSAGLDLTAFDLARDPKQPAHQAALDFYQFVQLMQQAFTCLEQCRIPVLAAIQGGCIGGGVDLATACDMRYARADAYFTIFEINIGMTADVGTFPRIVKLMPEGLARELAYTGRRMHADEALRCGLVNGVFDDQQALLEHVMSVAGEIARKPPIAIRGCKQIINHARDHRTADTLDYIALWNASMLNPPEMMEAMQANMQKRDGQFAQLPPLKNSVG